MPAIQRPEPTESGNPSMEPLTRTGGRADGRTGVKRPLRRHPFEFYEDQLATLKRFSLEDQLQGKNGSMSEMVRQAVDEYITKRKGN